MFLPGPLAVSLIGSGAAGQGSQELSPSTFGSDTLCTARAIYYNVKGAAPSTIAHLAAPKPPRCKGGGGALPAPSHPEKDPDDVYKNHNC
jgi:hypothetical protein